MTYTKEREDFFVPPSQASKIPEGKQIDKLTEMFNMQTVLDGRVVAERGIDKSQDEWVRDITVALESEIDEIRREINWKWWKNPKPVDKDALQGEVIDVWHFVLMLSRVVGLTPADIHRLYVEKNAENHARQSGTSDKDGYDASKHEAMTDLMKRRGVQ